MIKKTLKKDNKSAKNKNESVPPLKTVFKQSWLDLTVFWRSLWLLVATYALINFIFVTSFALFPSADSIQTDIASILGDSAGRVVDSITFVGISLFDVVSPTNTVMQFFLFIVASMAFIWMIRKQRGLQKVSVRQAFYEGPANIIPMLLTCILLLLTLIPSSIASTLLLYGIPIAGNALELGVLYAIASALLALSLYWLLVWWPAFYISMLPGTRPVAAMRAAAVLTKHKRSKLLLRGLAIWVLVATAFMVVVIPLAMLTQRLVPFTVYISLFIIFGVVHTVLFNLYRGLITDEQQSSKSKSS